jgi:hypothetical protein
MAAVINPRGNIHANPGSRRRLGATVAALFALASAGGCRDQQSFVVVTVVSAEDTPITSVVDFVVVVGNSGNSTSLTYTVPANQSPLTISSASILDPKTGLAGKTFSVSFNIGRTGDTTFQVTARDAARCTIGLGQNHQILARGGVANITVPLTHASGPCENGDAGTDSDNGVVFPGCDPAALTCGAGLTCAVNCAARQGQCVAAGGTPPGGLCDQHGNADCTPGTQCFTYSGPQCTVPVCLKFCKTNDDCVSNGSTSVCKGNVSCPTDGGVVPTAYHTCTFACDPHGAATTGCPVGLHCFVVDTMDQVDCSCTAATQVQTEGAPCTRGSDCAPGLICDRSTTKCQKVCRRGVGGDCPTGQSCTMLTNDMIYGVCL